MIMMSDPKSNIKTLKKQIAWLDYPRSPAMVLEATLLNDPSLLRHKKDLNTNPELIVCKNGVFNTRQQTLRPGNPDHLNTKGLDIAWKGIQVNAPVFLKFLDDTIGCPEQIRSIQVLLGCALTGNAPRENRVVMIIGDSGANGKSVFQNIIRLVFGPFCHVGGHEDLLTSGRTNPGGATPFLHAVQGMLVWLIPEVGAGSFNSALLKLSSGNDPLTTREVYGKLETWLPSHLTIIFGNKEPRAPADDDAFWRRVMLFRFTKKFVPRVPREPHERQADPYILDKIKLELPGILAWVVEGARQYFESGLYFPAVVKENTAEYRKSEDNLGDFIEQCCVTGDDLWVTARDVYQVFSHWWVENVSNHPPKPKAFGSLFGKRFKRDKNPAAIYLGVGLLDTTSRFFAEQGD